MNGFLLLHYTGLDLETGQRYAVFVRARNHAGLKKISHSDGFVVDYTPPETGRVVVGPNLYRTKKYHSNRTNIQARYKINA